MDGMDDFKDLYLQTARDRVQTLNDVLLKLEKNPTQLDIVEELMRTGHSLKGESAAMGYENIASLAHIIEDLFTAIGDGKMAINDEIMNELFNGLDFINASIDNIETNNTDLENPELLQKLKETTGLQTEIAGAKAPKSESTQQETTTEVVTTSEDPETPESDKNTPQDNTHDQNQADVKAKQISTVTLKIDKLDQMISTSEELVLLKMQLKNHSLIQENSDLKAQIHRLDRLVTDMQFHVMQARLFPISLSLHTIPRMVRDLSKKLERKVELVVEGDETTVDRTIIDHLTEPFVHLVRNAIDHGIELPADRVKNGKSETATLKISAYTKENKFYTEISDDGRGIEWEILAKSAIKKGMVSKEEVDSWTNEKQYHQLLYMDGASASQEITDISGRGVGLGAVKEAIVKLGGSIQVKTEVGVGTTFVMSMPMTLAIMQALLVKVNDFVYAMPSNAIVRSIQVQKENVKSTGNRAVIVVDKMNVPLFNLSKMFELNYTTTANSQSISSEVDTESKETVQKIVIDSVHDAVIEPDHEESSASKTSTIVLVHQDESVIGCLVDKIVAEEEILVKQLGPLLKQSNYFSGATILANGMAAPIINFEGLKWSQLKN